MLNEFLKKLKSNIYLIIPIFCIGLWCLYNLIHCNFTPFKNDFTNFYLGGQRILNNPTNLYKPFGKYTYTPALGTLFSVTISLLPHFYAQYVFYCVNLFLGVLFILEYDKILKLMHLEEQWHRFIFLLIISNGMIIYDLFYQNQFKFIVGVIFLFIIRREIQYKKENKEKTFVFYIIHYGLFVFAVGISPYFIFLLLMYLFQDIPFNELFNTRSIKKYFIVILWFILQNFLFILYPSLIFDFLSLFFVSSNEGFISLFYLREWFFLGNYFQLLNLILLLSIIAFTIVLIFQKDLSIEKKFIFSALVYVIFFTYAGRALILLFPISMLAFVPYVNQNSKGISFIKENLILLIGLLSIVGIYFMLPEETIFKYLKFLSQYPFVIAVNLRWIFLLCVFYISLLILYLKMNLNDKTNLKR